MIGRFGGRRGGRRPDSFGYSRGLAPILWMIFGLVAVEGAVVELVLTAAVPHTPWPWVALALHGGALLLLAGLYASFVTRPHRITERGLLLRDGFGTEITIPLRAVRAARPELRGNVGRSGFSVDGASGLLAHGDATVRLALDPDVPIRIGRNPSTPGLTTLFVSVDEPRRFVQTLAARPAGLQWGHAGGRGDTVAGPGVDGRHQPAPADR